MQMFAVFTCCRVASIRSLGFAFCLGPTNTCSLLRTLLIYNVISIRWKRFHVRCTFGCAAIHFSHTPLLITQFNWLKLTPATCTFITLKQNAHSTIGALWPRGGEVLHSVTGQCRAHHLIRRMNRNAKSRTKPLSKLLWCSLFDSVMIVMIFHLIFSCFASKCAPLCSAYSICRAKLNIVSKVYFISKSVIFSDTCVSGHKLLSLRPVWWTF